jgi:4-amino-4-deoxychorismate lyase
LVESIRVCDAVFERLDLHLDRMNRSRGESFGLAPLERLELPVPPPDGLYKCRVLYDSEIRSVEFVPYVPRTIRSLRLINDDSISYSYKFEDRSGLERLFVLRDGCDDIIIVKNGLLTDAYSANIVLEKDGRFFTPADPLLAGTRRAALLRDHRIIEQEISPRDIANYRLIHLVNAMLDLGECVVPVEAVRPDSRRSP